MLQQVLAHGREVLARCEARALGAGPLRQLRADLELLACAPTVRLSAARRLQGAESRRQSTAAALFAACSAVRTQIRSRYRGLRHQALRQAFGEGLPASAAKAPLMLAWATQLLAAASAHPAALREVRIRASTLARIERLAGTLRASLAAPQARRRERRQVTAHLLRVAARVRATCAVLEEGVPAAPAPTPAEEPCS